eukprot:m.266927 g.266927  ORF g.266927 m.266927 type:complete len:793 (-) comp26773_c0_seq1:155-2533(-)
MAEEDEEAMKRDEMLGYFHRVEQMFDSPEIADDAEQKDVFVENVLAEVHGTEIRSACDLVCSRVLERLLTMCSPEHMLKFFRRVTPSVEKMLENRYASHVLQTLVTRTALLVEVGDTPEPTTLDELDLTQDEVPDTVTAATLLDNVCRQFQHYLGDYLVSEYGSHVLRATLTALAGLPITSSSRSKASKKYRKKTLEAAPVAGPDGEGGATPKPKPSAAVRTDLPPCFQPVLAAIAKGVLQHPNLAPLLIHHTANPVVQTLLDALAATSPDLCAELVMAIAKPATDGAAISTSDFGRLMTHRVGSHLAEKVVEVASPILFNQIYVSHFRGRLKELATHQFAHFVVARLALSAHTSEEAGMIAAEVITSLEVILASGHPSVVVAAAEACGRHKTHQGQMVKGVFEAFHIRTAEDVRRSAHMIMALCTQEIYEEKTIEAAVLAGDAPASVGSGDDTAFVAVDQHGSRLLQALLCYKGQEIVPLTTSVLTIPTPALKKLAIDPAGSRLYESMLKADIGPKKRGKLIAKMKGQFAELAATKFGSRVVDKCWAAAEIKRKETIATELLKEEDMLKDNYFGRLVLRNCKIDYFKRKQDGWVEDLNANDRKRKMFSEFLEPGAEEGSAEPSEKEKKHKARSKAKADPAMAALGFGAVAASDDAYAEAALAVGDVVELAHREYSDAASEIDGLFKTTKKRKTDVDGDGDESAGAAVPAATSDPSAKAPKVSKKKEKKKAKAAADLEDIFSAVAATKKKGKKLKKEKEEKRESKSKKESGDKAGKSKKKDKEKKKKKFMLA